MRLMELCTNFRPGGIQRHAMDLAAWLRTQGHRVTLAGTPGAWLEAGGDPDFLALPVHAVGQGGGGVIPRLAALARSAAALRGFVRREGIELIHAHESAPALVARLATLGLNVPVVVTYHGSEPERVGQFGAVARQMTRTVSVSRRSGEDLVQRGGLPREQLAVIGLGVKPPAEPDPAEVAALRRELLGPDGRILVATVARLAHQKGIDVLVEVVRRTARPDIRFVVAGDGPQAELARQWAADAGIADRLIFAGRTDRPELYLKAADLFLLTSRWEALPFSIVEAFQMGTPALATDCGGVAELIDETVGRVLPIGDADAIAAAVLDLASHDEARHALAAAALARSREDRFSPDHIHRQIEGLYRELVGGSA